MGPTATSPPYPGRLERLRRVLSLRGLAGLILTRPEYGLYLTGVRGGPILVGESRVVRLDGIETEWSNVVSDAAPHRWHAAVGTAGLVGRPVGAELRYLTVEIERAMDACGSLTDVEEDLDRARLAKDADELAVIRARVRTLENAFLFVMRTARAGMSGLDVALAATAAISREAERMILFRGNLGAGRDCVDPDSRPTSRPLASGEAFFLDLYPDFGGYAADLTRCLTIGAPPRAVVDLHRTLEDALAAGLGTVRAGVRAADVDAAVRGVLRDARLLEYFPHHTGHGLGLFAREGPALVPGDETVLVPNAVLAIEPGVYVPGQGSFRLEVNVVVTEHGCVVLGQLPPRLLACES